MGQLLLLVPQGQQESLGLREHPIQESLGRLGHPIQESPGQLGHPIQGPRVIQAPGAAVQI